MHEVSPRAIFMIQMQRWHYHIPIQVPCAVRTPLLHTSIDCIQSLVSSFPRKECVTSAIAESNGTRVLGHWTIFKTTVEVSIPSAPFQKMQSFESSNGFFPLNAYFYPPVASTVIDPSVLDPLLYEDANPNNPQKRYPTIYYPNNFQPPQGFSTVESSIPEPVPSEIDEVVSYPTIDYPNNFQPPQGFSTVESSSIPEPVPSEIDEVVSYPSTYDPSNFLPLQGFSMFASSSIPEPVVDPSETDPNGIVNNEAWNFPWYLKAYHHTNLPLQGSSRDRDTAHPQVIPASPADNIRNRYSSAIPAAKPSVRKTRIRNRQRLGEEGRIEYLQNDAYVMSFGETWVICAGCGKTIQLDSRKGARYYAGFWLAHKKLCSGVKKEIVRFLSEFFFIEPV